MVSIRYDKYGRVYKISVPDSSEELNSEEENSEEENSEEENSEEENSEEQNSEEENSETTYVVTQVDTTNIENLLGEIRVGVGFCALFNTMLFFILVVYLVTNWLGRYF